MNKVDVPEALEMKQLKGGRENGVKQSIGHVRELIIFKQMQSVNKIKNARLFRGSLAVSFATVWRELKQKENEKIH